MYWIILAACVSLIWTALWSCLLMAAGADLRWKRFNGGRTLKAVSPTVVMIPLVLSAHRNLNRRGHRLGRWLAFHHAVQ